MNWVECFAVIYVRELIVRLPQVLYAAWTTVAPLGICLKVVQLQHVQQSLVLHPRGKKTILDRIQFRTAQVVLGIKCETEQWK